MADSFKRWYMRSIFVAVALFSLPAVLCAQGAGGASNLTSTGAATASVSRADEAAFATIGRARNSTREAMMYMKLYGIDNIHVQETSSGALLRFSYRVVDASKAKVLNDKKNSPILTVQKNGAKLEVPTTERVGQLRQVATPENGREYWMIFGNKSHAAQVGDRVDIVIGTFRSSGLVVEPSQVHTARKP